MNQKFISFLILFLLAPIFSSSQGIKEKNNSANDNYYQIFGKGIPILIINGGPGMNSQGFTELAKDISDFGYMSIIYDQRGTGQSSIKDISEKSMKIDLMVEDIETLRKILEIDQWLVMGHSFGGMLAYSYAVNYPERTLGLIQSSSGGMDLSLLELIDIPAFLTPAEQDSLSYYTQKIQRGDTTYTTRLKRGEFLAPAYVYDRKHIPTIAHRLTQGNSRINSLIWEDLRKMNFDLKKELKSYNKPTLIIQGKEDILGTSLAIEADEIIPNSELVILKNTRHYGWLDSPQQFYSSIKSYLDKHFGLN